VGSVPVKPEAASRSIGMLRTAMGPTITGWLEDPAIVEVMLNSDGRLLIDRLAGGLSDTGKRLSEQDGERIVRVVAHHVGAEASRVVLNGFELDTDVKIVMDERGAVMWDRVIKLVDNHQQSLAA
jgi:hypothetical protein